MRIEKKKNFLIPSTFKKSQADEAKTDDHYRVYWMDLHKKHKSY